jgi:hypothetical protein
MYTYFSWIFRKIITFDLVYYYNLVGIYRVVTLSPARVLHCIIVYPREVEGGYRNDETLVKRPSSLHIASNILLGVTMFGMQLISISCFFANVKFSFVSVTILVTNKTNIDILDVSTNSPHYTTAQTLANTQAGAQSNYGSQNAFHLCVT